MIMKLITTFSLILIGVVAYSQNVSYDTLLIDDLERSHILYIPEMYDGSTNVPLVLNFHGYGSNAEEQMAYGNFRPISDTAGFLIVHPQGTQDSNNTNHWNVNWGTSTVDDVSYIDQLIAYLLENYSINPDRIYSTGMSNGGFFSYKLACELPEKITAIASVTGTMTLGQSANCDYVHPMPVMEIHGTSDFVVPYDGSMFGFIGIEDVLSFWQTFNSAQTLVVDTMVANSNMQDGSTAQHIIYRDESTNWIEHYRIDGGGHTWPGSEVQVFGTNYDINASKEIWRFFSQFDASTYTSASEPYFDRENQFTIQPSVVANALIITFEKAGRSFIIYSESREITTGVTKQNQTIVDVSELLRGVYFIRIGNTVEKFIKM